MRRLLLIALALVLGCSHDATAPSLPIRADNLSLSVSFISLEPGQTAQLFIQHTSNGKAYTGNAVWSSSDEGVASVDQNGLVTAVAGGVATVRATNAAGTQDDGSASVTVSSPVPLSLSPVSYACSTWDTNGIGSNCHILSGTLTGTPNGLVHLTDTDLDAIVATFYLDSTGHYDLSLLGWYNGWPFGGQSCFWYDGSIDQSTWACTPDGPTP